MSDLFRALKDIAMTPDGDIMLGMNDVKYVNGIDWFIQEVNKIIRSTNNEWYFTPYVGADMAQYYGSNNTRQVAADIEHNITDKIKRQGIDFPATLSVRAIPITKDSIKIYISLFYAGNTLKVQSLIFDMQNGSLKETQDIVAQQPPVIPKRNTYINKFL